MRRSLWSATACRRFGTAALRNQTPFVGVGELSPLLIKPHSEIEELRYLTIRSDLERIAVTKRRQAVALQKLLAKPHAIFGRGKKGFHHFGVDEVAVEVVKLPQPKVISGIVGVLRVIGITAQVAEVLH